ncbi:toll/interleukin-1 receptor domain-containing protein [Salegentibacter sp. HM20]
MNQPKIFLSYSHRNKEKIDKIRKILIDNGYFVLSDYEVKYGEFLSEKIFEQILEADYYVTFITPQYFESQNSSNEFYKILGYSQENRKKTILPVLLDYTMLPPEIGNRLYLDCIGMTAEDVALSIIKAIFKNEGQKAAEKEKIEKRIEKINTSIVQYIEPIIEDLEERESELKKKANLWNWIGYLSIVIGVIGAIIIIITDIFNNTNFDWNKTIYLGIKGAILLILLLASSKYAFTLSKSYMSESIKNADRIHAISFGKFYINVFESSINPNDFKEIFENWNLTTDSSFSSISTNNYDPKIIEKTNDLIRSIKDISKN